jgi:outer membrane protein assembly factor BamA/autotransporter translocation and assembly factor TamB
MARSRIGRIVLRTLAIGAGIVVLCLLLIALGLFPQEWLRSIVERQVRTALGPQSRIGRMHVVPGRLRADASDVVIEGRGFRLEIAQLRLALAWPTITGKALALRSIEAQRPVLTIWPVEPLADPEPPTPLEKSVLIGDIRVTNGSLVYRDPTMGGDWRVEGVTMTGGIGESALKLETGPVRWERPEPLVLEPIHGTLTVSPMLNARLESLQIATRRSRVTASGDIGDLMQPQPDVDVQLHVDLADAAMFTAAAPPMTGVVTGQGHVSGLGAALKADGQVEGRGLRVSGYAIDDVNARYSVGGGKTQLTFTGHAMGGPVKGNADLEGTRVEATIEGADLDLARLAAGATAGPPPVSGRTTIHASARGQMSQRIEVAIRLNASGKAAAGVGFTADAEVGGALLGAESRADLQWKASGTADQPADPAGNPTLQNATWTASGTAVGAWPAAIVGQIHGEGRFAAKAGASPFTLKGRGENHGTSSAATVELAGELGEVTLDARTGARGTTVVADARNLRLDRFVPDARGTAQFSFRGSGQGDAFRGAGDGNIADLQWQKARLGAVAFKVTAAGRDTRVQADVPALNTRAEATLVPVRRGASELAVAAHVELRDAPLEALAALAPTPAPGQEPITGRITATIDVPATPLATIAQARVEGRIERLDVTQGQITAATRGPFTFQATREVVQLRDLDVAGDGFSLKTSGTFAVAPRGRVDGVLQAEVDLAKVPVPAAWSVAGTLRADVRLAGTRARPVATGGLDLVQVAASGPSVPPLRVEDAHIELAGETLRLPDITATVAGGTVRLNGMMPLAAILPAAPGTVPPSGHLDIVWQGVSATEIQAAAMPQSETTLSGSLDGEAHIEGPLTVLEALTARVRTPPLTLVVSDMPINLSGLAMDVRGGRLTMEPMQIGTSQGQMQLTGGADLKARTLAFQATGNLDLRSLSPLIGTAALTGRSELNLTVSGPFAKPQAQGRMTVARGSIRMREIQPAITDITATLLFEGATMRIEGATARWGGGPVELAGEAKIEGATVTDARFTVTGKELALRYLDTKTRVDADLTLSGKTGAFLLAGSVNIDRALYDRDIFLDEPMRAPVVMEKSSPFLRTLGLDLRVRTTNPFLVRNNLASLQAVGDLTVRGDAENPAVFGTLEIEPAGEVTLQEHTFVIEEDTLSVIRYSGSLDPDVNITLRSKQPIKWSQGDDDTEQAVVIVEATGPLRQPILKFGVSPDDLGRGVILSDTQIVSLLATGRIDPGSGGAWVLGEQAAALLAGRASRRLSRQLQRLGFDQVTIEPNLLAQEEDPSARFTFGKNLTNWSDLVYSLGLEDAESRFFQLNVHPMRNFTTELRRADDGTVTGAFKHRLRFGAPKRIDPGDDRTRIEEVALEGRLPVEPETVRQWLRTKPGKKVTFWDLQDDSDRVRRHLVELGNIEAQVNARLEANKAVFVLRPGPRYTWRVDGMTNPPELKSVVESALFAEEALEKGEQRILEELRSRGHYRAEVQTTIQGQGRREGRTLLFLVEPGAVYRHVDVLFEGASAISSGRLTAAAGGPGELITRSAVARKRVEDRYREAYYLNASVGPPRVEEVNGGLVVHVPVEEGPQARIERLTFAGHALPEEELRSRVGSLEGTLPDELRLNHSVGQLREHYFSLGYPSVRISTRLMPLGSNLELVFDVQEGSRVVIREIVFEGYSRIDQKVLRSELPFKPGDPLDPKQLTLAESRLRKYGLARANVRSDATDPGRVIVEVAAPERASLRYALQVDSNSSPGASVEARTPNLLSNGLTLGGSYEFSRFEQEGRGTIRLPAFFHRGFLNLYVAQNSQDRILENGRVPTGDESADQLFHLVTRTAGLTQIVELNGQWQFEYGYVAKHVTTQIPTLPESIEADIGRLQLSLLRDTRDHILNARRGRFWSLNFSYTPPILGTDLFFVKTFGQAFAYRDVFPNVTWAQGYRLGLGFGLKGQRFTPIERFEAGGANTLRGFKTGTVGPGGTGVDKAGGAALLVINEELRYHHASGLGAAIFYDVGNVFEKVSDMDFQLLHTVGAGLRYDSPVGMVRVDLGLPLNRREGDRRYRIYFSLGQAF